MGEPGLCLAAADAAALGRLRTLRTLVLAQEPGGVHAPNANGPPDLSPLLALRALETLALDDSLLWTEAALATAARLTSLKRLRLCLPDRLAAGSLRLLAPLTGLKALSLELGHYLCGASDSIGSDGDPGAAGEEAATGCVLDGLGALQSLSVLQLSAANSWALRESSIAPLASALAECPCLAHLQLSGSNMRSSDGTVTWWSRLHAALAAALPAVAVRASSQGTRMCRVFEGPGPLLAWTHSISDI